MASRPRVKNPPSGAKRGPQCKACNHGKRDQVDHALATGGTIRNVASRFGLSVGCVHRHQAEHLAPAAEGAAAAIVKAAEAYEADVQSKTARAILTKIRVADRLLAGAEEDRDWGAAVRAISEFRSIWMDVAKLTGELKTGPAVEINLTASPEWLAIEGRFAQLRDARPELLAELRWLASGEGPIPGAAIEARANP